MTELPLTRLTFGHGHVTPNPNGLKARCGGPGLCPDCSQELAASMRLTVSPPADLDPSVKPADPTPSMINSGRELPPTLDLNVKPTAGFPAANDAVKDHQRAVIAALRNENAVQSAEIIGLREELDESDQLRDRMASLLTETAAALKGTPPPRVMHDWSDLPQVAAQRAEQAAQAAQLRYERQLLGTCRVLLDGLARTAVSVNLQRAAGDLAQRITDEIGHPVTDEPALGPDLRSMLDIAWALISHAYAPEYGGTDWIRTAAGWAESYERLTGHVTMGSVQNAQPVQDVHSPE